MAEKKEKKKMSTARKVIIIICSVILAAAIAALIYTLVEAGRATQLAEDTVARYLIPIEDEDDTDDGDGEFRVDWEGLWAVNPDVVAWIRIPAIPIISYPVIHYTDNTYYLRRSWTGEPLNAGCIMEDFHCSTDFTDFHTIVYGHNMTTGDMAGTMFGQLKQYQDQNFYDENDDLVIIYTPEATLTYTIFSIRVVQPNDTSVYTVGDFSREEAFSFAEVLRDRTEVNTGVWADGDDKILTLSTCSGLSSTRRLVVHCVLTEAIDTDGRNITGTFGRIYEEPEEITIDEPDGINTEPGEGETPQISETEEPQNADTA